MPITYRPPAVQKLPQTGILEVNDTLDYLDVQANQLSEAYNVYPKQIGEREIWVGRPGYSPLQSVNFTDGVKRRVQGLFALEKINGDVHHFMVAGGILFELLTGVWTPLTGPAGPRQTVPFHPTNLCHAVTFFDKLIIVDNFEQPIEVAGGGANFTILTNAPKAKGNPVVHFAKLFFINLDAPNEVQWSEENQSNTGYAVGGYNNAWQIVQTSVDAFNGMAALEDALLLFRSNSITAIFGSVTPEFRSTGVREAISEVTGTTTPGSIIVTQSGVMFFDAQFRPCVVRPGAQVQVLDNNCKTAVSRIAPFSTANNTFAVYDKGKDLVLMVGQGDVNGTSLIALVFHGEKMKYCGTWENIGADVIAYMKTINTNQYRLFHAQTLFEAPDVNTATHYIHGTEDSGPWTDTCVSAGARAIVHRIAGSPLGYNIDTEWQFMKIHILMRNPGVSTGMSFNYKTSRGDSTPLTFIPPASGSAIFDVSLFDDPSAVFSGDSSETKNTIGLNGKGRYLIPRITADKIGERFGWLAFLLEAQPNNGQWQAK